MKRSPLIISIAYFSVLLFLYTGVVKLMDIHLFREQLISSPLVGPIAGFISWALPIGEIIIAILLFIPRFRLTGLYLSAILMILFTFYVVALMLIDNHLSCSCGGIIEDLSLKQHLLFNSACVILSVVGIAVARKQKPTPQFKWVTASGAAVLFLVAGLVLFTAFTTPPTIKTGMEGRLLPSFELLLPDSTTNLSTKDIPTGRTTIFIGFSPVCIHCQQLIFDIIDHIDSFRSVKIYLVTAYPFDGMKSFYKNIKLARFPDMIMAWDKEDVFLSYFKATGVPYTIVLDEQKRVKQVMSTRFDASQLAKIARE